MSGFLARMHSRPGDALEGYVGAGQKAYQEGRYAEAEELYLAAPGGGR